MEHVTQKHHFMDTLGNKLNKNHLWKTIGLFIIKEVVAGNLSKFNNPEDKLSRDRTKRKLLKVIMGIGEKARKTKSKLSNKNKSLTLFQEKEYNLNLFGKNK